MELTPGWKTSEFWTMIFTTVINILSMTGFFTPEESSDLVKIIPMISGGIGQAIITIGYAISRGKAKGK